MIEQVRKEDKEKADLFSVVTRITAPEEPAPSPPETSSCQPNLGVEEKGGPDLAEPEPALSPDPSPKVQNDTPEQPGQGHKDSTSSAVLVVQLDANETPRTKGPPIFQGEPPFHHFLGNLKEKGVAHKFYLSTTLENELEHEALLDTGADVTLMSPGLFNKLRALAHQANRDLKLQQCSLEIQPYSPTGTTLTTRGSD